MLQYDAQAAFGFVVSARAYVEREVNQQVYPDVQYQELVPVDTSANPFAKTVTYYSGDRFGAAQWINGNADDIPKAGTELSQHETAVYTAGIGYGYGWEEINQALSIGYNLPAEDAIAARRAYEEFVDRVAMIGDARKGMFGLVNYPTVPATAVPNGDWDAPTTMNEQIIADFNAILMGSYAGTLFTSMANTVLIPHEKLQTLGSRFLASGQTLLAFINANNLYTATTGAPLRIRAVRGLLTAGVGGLARMVAYRRDPGVLKMHIPMVHRFLPVWQSGPLRWDVPGVFRLGGLDVRRPLEVRYGDGI